MLSLSSGTCFSSWAWRRLLLAKNACKHTQSSPLHILNNKQTPGIITQHELIISTFIIQCNGLCNYCVNRGSRPSMLLLCVSLIVGDASVKIDALFAVALWGSSADWRLEAARRCVAPGPCVAPSDSSSEGDVPWQSGKNEKVGKRANAFQETGCQAAASLESHHLLTSRRQRVCWRIFQKYMYLEASEAD